MEEMQHNYFVHSIRMLKGEITGVYTKSKPSWFLSKTSVGGSKLMQALGG